MQRAHLLDDKNLGKPDVGPQNRTVGEGPGASQGVGASFMRCLMFNRSAIPPWRDDVRKTTKDDYLRVEDVLRA
jgi:hypothetical protein